MSASTDPRPLLSARKRPREVRVVRGLRGLPRNTMGKVVKTDLR